MVGEASGRMQKADCRDEIALPAAMLAWLKYRKQRTRNSRKRFLVFFCSLFVKARVVYRLPKVHEFPCYCALRQELDAVQFSRLFRKHLDKFVSDDHSLFLRIVYPGKLVRIISNVVCGPLTV